MPYMIVILKERIIYKSSNLSSNCNKEKYMISQLINNNNKYISQNLNLHTLHNLFNQGLSYESKK